MVFYFMLSFFHEMSWRRSGTELNQILRTFLPFSLPLHEVSTNLSNTLSYTQDYSVTDR